MSKPQNDKTPYSVCTLEIPRDEDWRDTWQLQRLMADGSIATMDTSQVTKLELFIRPTFDHSMLIYKLSSALSEGGEISFNNTALITVVVLRDGSGVIANIPTGKWDQFLIATYAGGAISELWRGPLIVHPGKAP
jgi:hypothetical protein